MREESQPKYRKWFLKHQKRSGGGKQAGRGERSASD
jgi:hypothetical protein